MSVIGNTNQTQTQTPKVETQAQTQTPPPPTTEVYDDSVEAYTARRDAWLAAAETPEVNPEGKQQQQQPS